MHRAWARGFGVRITGPPEKNLKPKSCPAGKKVDNLGIPKLWLHALIRQNKAVNFGF